MRNRNDKIISIVLGSLALPIVLLCVLIILTFVYTGFSASILNLETLRDAEVQGMFLSILKNTLLISLLSLAVSAPIAYFAAFNLCFIQEGKIQSLLFSLIRILASFPSVLLGLLIASLLVPSSGSGSFILYASLVLSAVILPFLCNNFCTDMLSVPVSHLLASDTLGMSPSQKLRYLIHPYIRKKAIGSLLLALCRCIGEATALFIVCSAISQHGGNAQYTFASYILYSFTEGMPKDHIWQLAVLTTVIFTIIYYLLFFLQQKIRGGDQ